MGALMLVTLVGAASCQRGGNGPAADNAPSTPKERLRGESIRWPFWPTQMRIHPLTRIAINRDTGDRVVEARVEFKDRDNSTTRCVGEMKFVLYSKDGGRASEYINEWVIGLVDIERNAEHFDEVTRTYLFRLEIGSEVQADRYDLRAFFTSVNDDIMQSQYIIPAS